MDEELIVVEEEVVVEGDTAVSPTNTSRRIALASVGIVIVISNEMQTVVNKIVTRGEALADDDRSNLPVNIQTTRRSLRRRLQRPVNKMLHRLNIPTKTDIDSLNTQITALLNKVESLQAQEQLDVPDTPVELSATVPIEAENEP
ncbi:MAG: hypothetical protein GY796_27885 [Chloroflexi bacterium]|nr:hypothetical protein [Chloroflexota bacterium]